MFKYNPEGRMLRLFKANGRMAVYFETKTHLWLHRYNNKMNEFARKRYQSERANIWFDANIHAFGSVWILPENKSYCLSKSVVGNLLCPLVMSQIPSCIGFIWMIFFIYKPIFT